MAFLTLAALPLLLATVEVEAFPRDPGFPSPIAGPASRGFGFSRLAIGDITTPDTGEAFYALKLGSLFGIVRVADWRFGIDAGFLGLFDIDQGYDNLGWDGNYGVMITHPVGKRVAARVAWLHTSSHVGDEFAERTGRTRIGYTRQELALGLSWRPGSAWRLYGEYGYGLGDSADDPGQPGRLQAGAEWEHGARWGPYAAMDVQAWQERDWNADLAIQAGFAFRDEGRRWRLGLEYYDGRVPIGEFFNDDLRHLAVGLFFDLGGR